MAGTENQEHCSGCSGWIIPEGKERSECEQGTCGDESSPNKGRDTLFAEGCVTWKPVVLQKAPLQ